MDKEAWRAAWRGVVKSRVQLSDLNWTELGRYRGRNVSPAYYFTILMKQCLLAYRYILFSSTNFDC